MIKTIVAETPDELDEKVNAFMREKKQNLAVRDGCNGTPEGTLQYKAMVFFNEDFEKKQIADLEEQEQHEEKHMQPKDTKGALWAKNGKITGNWHGYKIELLPLEIESLTKNGTIDMKILNLGYAHIIKNQYKKKPNQPDYIIFPKN